MNSNTINKPAPPIRTLIVDDESLARKLVASLISMDAGLEVIGECSNGEQALAAIKAGQPDLVLLDVKMPLLDGIQLAKRLVAEQQHLPYIIFLTAFDHYAIEAFTCNALDYLVKPVQKARFRASLERAKQAIKQKEICDLTERILALGNSFSANTQAASETSDLLVWQGAEAVNIRPEDIIWIEAANQYARIHLHNNSILLSKSLGALYKQLNQAQFRRVHRSAVINTDYLQRIIKKPNGAHQLVMQNGTQLPLARSRKDQLSNLLMMSQQNNRKMS